MLQPARVGSWTALAAALALVGPAAAQNVPDAAASADGGAEGAALQTACPAGRISYLFVDPHSIFDPDDLGEERPFAWAYRLANALHVRTRASFVEAELLFEVGDCYDPALLEESERILRLHGFISRVDVFGLEQPDGSWHVVVDTKDEWTTKLQVDVRFEEGLEFRGIELAEENLLGRGLLVGVFFREFEEQRDIGAELFTPRTLGTRVDLRLSAGRTRIGSFVEQRLAYPFVGEVGRVAARQIYVRQEQFFPYSLGVRAPEPGEATHVLLPMDEERVELTLAGRLGTPGNLTTLGLGISNSTLDFPDFPGGVEVARAGDFGNREVAPPALVHPIAPQTRHSSATRLNLLAGQRNVSFVQRSGLDALVGLQDVAVGTDVGVTLGRSAPGLTDDEQPVDVYSRMHAFFGWAPPSLTVNAVLNLEGRYLLQGGIYGEGWKDVLAELDLLAYWQPPALAAHTFFVRVSGGGGWDTQQPFQLTLGGPTGLRGYHDDDLPAGRRLQLTLEDRIYVRWPVPDLFDLGFTLFAETARGWAGDTPFATDTGWLGTVGGGLRLGFPAGTRSAVRVDLAFPTGPGTGLKDAVLRISLRDLLGIAAGFESRQLARSRRVDVGPDRFTDRARR